MGLKYRMYKKLIALPFVRSSSIYVGGQLLGKSIPFLMLPFITRYLSPSEYGVIANFMSFSAIMLIVVGMSMHGAINANYFRMEKKELGVFIGNVLSVSFILCIIFLSVIWFASNELEIRTGINSFWLVTGVLIAFSQFVVLVNLTLWMVESKATQYVSYQTLQALLSAVLSLIFIAYFYMGIRGQLLSLSLTAFFSFGCSAYILYRRGYVSFSLNSEHIKDAIKFGIPMIPHDLGGWLKTGADRFIITSIAGVAATGLYAVSYQIAMIIAILTHAINQAYMPYIFKKLSEFEKGENKSNSSIIMDIKKSKIIIVKFTYLYFILILCGATILGVASNWLLPLFLGDKFSEAGGLVLWVCIGFAFDGMYYMVVNYIFYSKRTYVLASITLLASFLHVFLSYILVSREGPEGAAKATAISFAITFLFVWVASARIYPMPWFNFMRSPRLEGE